MRSAIASSNESVWARHLAKGGECRVHQERLPRAGYRCGNPCARCAERCRVDEVRARLYRTQCPWLIVFDNVENLICVRIHSSRQPRARTHSHHLTNAPPQPSSKVICLDCFSPKESVAFLSTFVGDDDGDDGDDDDDDEEEERYKEKLANVLGHLPLALSLAAAYIVQCDITFKEYLERMRHMSSPGVDATLNLSLERIASEDAEAMDVLSCLAFLASEGVTGSSSKPLSRRRVLHLWLVRGMCRRQWP